jgi:hypothetical protein
MVVSRMSLWEFELADEAVDRIAQVFERHRGGAFDAAALRDLDHHAYAVRICTNDELCREKLGFIQDRAAVYFSDKPREGEAPTVEVLGYEIQSAIGSLRERLCEMRSEATS